MCQRHFTSGAICATRISFNPGSCRRYLSVRQALQRTLRGLSFPEALSVLRSRNQERGLQRWTLPPWRTSANCRGLGPTQPPEPSAVTQHSASTDAWLGFLPRDASWCRSLSARHRGPLSVFDSTKTVRKTRRHLVFLLMHSRFAPTVKRWCRPDGIHRVLDHFKLF